MISPLPQRSLQLGAGAFFAWWWTVAFAPLAAAGDVAQLAMAAETQFALGLEQLETTPGEARDSLARAAGMYELLADHPQARSAPARHNAANAWLLADDPGRALLNYRRALLLRPGDRVAQNGLREARSRRATQVTAGLPPGSLQHFRDRLAIEHRGWLWTALLAANACLWIAAAMFLRSKSARSQRLILAGGVGTVLALVVLLWSDGARPGVITAREVVGRHGNGSVYQPAWRSPLTNGVEFSLQEQRDDWWRIRLADGSQGWIPANSAGLVHSPAP